MEIDSCDEKDNPPKEGEYNPESLILSVVTAVVPAPRCSKKLSQTITDEKTSNRPCYCVSGHPRSDIARGGHTPRPVSY